ncbi:MAG: hypothetical protein IKE65_02270 [Clostridia bacterium]|nr:hypothetical protein [Clostridia bacterium]
MKKIFKKGFCVILAIAMIACGVIPAFAVDQTPVVLVPGVINVPIYDASGNQVLMPDFKNKLDLESTIDALKEVLHLQDTGAYDQAIDKLIGVAKDLFDDARCDENGDSVLNTHYAFPNGSIAQDPESAHYSDESAIARMLGQKIGNKNVYIFTYDWRMDVVGIVDNSLAPLIDRVKKETGSDKVTICAASMGSAITNTYLSKYGNRDDVKKVIFISGAGQGVQFVQDIYLTRPVCVNRKAMGPYFKTVLGALGGIGISAVSRYACEIAQKLMDSQYEKLWTQFVEKDLLCWPSMWELAGHTKDMEALLKSTKNETFQKKVMEYYGYQDNLKNTMDALKEKGVEICYTSNYNLTGVPATPKADVVNTDYLIDTYHTSFGATVADLGKTLGDDYTQKNDDGHNHLSEDGVIDASTCYSPETTWFIKDLLHVSFQDKAPQTAFICWLVLTDNVTIESNPEKYPQFMQFTTEKDEKDKEVKSLVSVKKVEIETPSEEGEKGPGSYVSSAVTVYTYTQITGFGWALIIALVALLIILIAKRRNKGPIEGVLTKAEIKALPKSERKAAKKQNKARIKEWKKQQKANKKARKAELKAMPRKERKAAKKADKKAAKAARKQAKADAKAAKKQAKLDKKAAKAAKKNK